MPARATEIRQTVMHDGILVTFRHTRQAFVPFTNWREALINARAIERDIPLPSELLCALHAFAIQAKRLCVFIFVQHWHVLAATPTPQNLHRTLILTNASRQPRK
jgi:hypothetical protein